MSVTVRTNRATNPHAASNTTDWLDIDGTSGVAAIAHNTGTGLQRAGFARVTWSTGTSAISGGIQKTQTGLSASTAYAIQMWVRPSQVQTMRLTVVFRNGSNGTVNTINGSATACPANVWTALQVAGTSGAAVTNALVQGLAFTGGSNWTPGDILDGGGVLIETGSTFNSYYDGATPDGGAIVYAWTGSAETSTSTATVYVPTLTLTGHNDMDPCPRVDIDIADLDPSVNEITIWRTADGVRKFVRGTREWAIEGSNSITDYEVPLNRSVQYELEVIEGISAEVVSSPQSVTVTTTFGTIQDPLDPASALKLYTDLGPGGEPSFTLEALAQFDYDTETNLVKIIGSPDAIAFIGQRMAASNVPFHVFTDVAQQSTDLRTLLAQAAPVLIRPLPGWANALPALCYVSVKTVNELPFNEAFGGQVIEWKLVGDLVAAPTVNIVVAAITYGTVQALWSTYQSAQTALSGDTYLQVKKSPSGA